MSGPWLKRTSLGILVGVLVTVALAWYVAVRPATAGRAQSSAVSAYVDPASGKLIRVVELRWFGVRHGYAVRAMPQETLTPADRPSWLPSNYTPDQILRRTYYGWPFAAFVTGDRSKLGPPATSTSSLSTIITLEERRVFTVDFRGSSYSFPYVPSPLGFAANVGLWACAYILLATAIAKLRPRRRPGFCPKCRYNLRGLPAGAPCPECGASPAGAAS